MKEEKSPYPPLSPFSPLNQERGKKKEMKKFFNPLF